jgi:hypothetical protein
MLLRGEPGGDRAYDLGIPSYGEDLIEQLLSDVEVVGQGDLEEAADPACELVCGVASWEAPCDVYDFLWG